MPAKQKKRKVTASRAKQAKAHGKPSETPKRPDTRMRRVDAALARYEKACRIASARGEALAALAREIGEAAAERHSAKIIQEMCKRQLLRDIVELRDAFTEQAPGSLSPRLEALRLLPDAFLQWLETHFRLTPVGAVGKILEIPIARLDNYTCTFDVPTDANRLVRVCVVETGWKRGDAVLMPPRVRLAEQPESVLRDSRRSEKSSERKA